MASKCPSKRGSKPAREPSTAFTPQGRVLYAPPPVEGSVTETPALEELRDQFRAVGQGHVFEFWDELGEASRKALLAQAAAFAPLLAELTAAVSRSREGAATDLPLAPVDAVLLPENGGDRAQLEAAREAGESILRAGRVAAFVVAGGQGTRLGFPGPKGSFPIGPISGRTLFELQAQKIRGLARRYGRTVPWYVMTSDATHPETVAQFERERFFGIDPGDVRIFSQQMVPAFDFEGRMILERPDRIFESPNGHGGALTALESSGALDDMRERGIDTLFYYQVDNPLVKICDPVFLGLHHQAGADLSCKVIRKVDPDEKVGVLARLGEDVTVVEYTELRDEHRHARDAAGRFVFWAGNAAIHVFAVDFVGRMAAEADRHLPYHLSAKKIPSFDRSGKTMAPNEPNGYKLERFVFDALPAAARICIQEVSAAEDFSPIKNAEGADSPESARRDLVSQYRRWLEPTDLSLPPKDQLIEIDHSVIDGPEDALAAGLSCLEGAGGAVRVGAGAEA